MATQLDLRALTAELLADRAGRARLGAALGEDFRKALDLQRLLWVQDRFGGEGLRRVAQQMEHNFCCQSGQWPTTPLGYWGA